MDIKLTYSRRKTSQTRVGNLMIGSDYPIRIQTMANTNTNDIEGSVAQARRCFEAGAELLRYTTQGMKEVESLRQIKESLAPSEAIWGKGAEGGKGAFPLVADIHFRSDVADAAAAVVEKVRVNPGNYANDPATIRERFCHLMDICREHGTAIRIGVNHGSLSPRMMEKYGDTPEGIVESCMEFLRIAVEYGFNDIVLSVKASNTRVMVDSVRMLVQQMDKEGMAFPLHLGVTEAGEGEDGRTKSAVGIGALLADGIGDTIRVSLSEEPEAELPVARALRDYFADPDSPRYHGNSACIEEKKLIYTGTETDPTLFALHAAAECGHLLWDNGLTDLEINAEGMEREALDKLAADILQAARIRMYKTEFISCPGCGRTMFDLQQTVTEIKRNFSHLKGLKIGVMGCIVNGPGEMADADYGYVGAGRDRISLYKKTECVRKNIPAAEAVKALIELIRENGDWVEPA